MVLQLRASLIYMSCNFLSLPKITAGRSTLVFYFLLWLMPSPWYLALLCSGMQYLVTFPSYVTKDKILFRSFPTFVKPSIVTCCVVCMLSVFKNRGVNVCVLSSVKVRFVNRNYRQLNVCFLASKCKGFCYNFFTFCARNYFCC